MNALDVRDRRALWLGALIVLPVLFWRGVVSPFDAAVSGAQERAEQSRALLAREQAALLDAPRLPAALAALRLRGVDEAPRLFGGADTVAATAALANWVRSAAAGAGLHSAQASAGPVDPVSGELRAVSVDLRAEGDFGAVAAWIELMDSGERALVVDRLDISASGNDDGTVAISARVRGFSASFAAPVAAVRGRRP